MKTKIYASLLLAFLISILLKAGVVKEQILTAVSLFETKVFPSLFPFLVLSPFFIQYGLFDFIKKVFGPLVRKIFRISENGAYLFFMSMISGFPSSAGYAKNLEEKNLLSQKEATHILLFSHFSNPLFIFSMVSTRPLLVLTCHYLGNVILGFVFRFFSPIEDKQKETLLPPKSFFEIFSSSIHHAMENLLFILGVIVFFFCVNAIFPNPITNFCLELSQGLHYLNTLNISPKMVAVLSCFLLSFGGFSVHLQTFGILAEWKISYLPYLATRIIHGVLSSICLLFLY